MEFMMAILWHKRPSGFFELFCGLVLMCALSLAPSRAFADHAVHEVKGDHGLWAWVLPEKDVSFTQIAISFEGGVAAEKEDESGLAALYATILEMSHGQEDNEIEFSRLLQRLGIQVNYSAGVEEIHVSVSIFSEGKSEKVSKAFKFLKDIFRKPPLSSEVIRRAVRESIAERHNADSNAEYQARNLWYAKFYKGHRYGVPLNGDIDVIKDISTRYAKRSWSRFFNRENVNIVIVGEIDDTSVKEWLDSLYETLPEAPSSYPVVVKKPSLSGTPRSFPKWFDTPHSSVLFGQQAVVPNDSRFRAALVMNYLLDDRLNKSLREKNGLVYNVTTDLNFFKKSAVFIGSTATETQSVPKLQELVRSEWARVLGGDIPMDELSYAKINMQGKFNQNMRFPWARALYLMTALEYDLGMDYLSKRNKLVDAVTREDVRSVARDLLRPDDLFFVIVGRHKPEDFQNINKTE